MPINSKHAKARLLPNLTDSFPLQLAQVPTPDLVIFVSMTTMTMMTEPITLPLVYARGLKYP